jgi:hypothetical protein
MRIEGRASLPAWNDRIPLRVDAALEPVMKTLALLLAAAACLQGFSLASPAQAEPLVLSRSLVDNGYVKRPRYCDQHSRCWTEGYRNALLDSYNFATPPRYAKSEKMATGKVAIAAKTSGRVAKAR